MLAVGDDAADPDRGAAPHTRSCELGLGDGERILLNALLNFNVIDPSLGFRRSCRGGICGSDAMDVNGRNDLACVSHARSLPGNGVPKPLPGLPVIRDLFVDMTGPIKQYHSIRCWLVNDDPSPEKEHLQSPEARDALNGLYECIRCARGSGACPGCWRNPDKYVAAAGLPQAIRFLVDSRDQASGARLTCSPEARNRRSLSAGSRR